MGNSQEPPDLSGKVLQKKIFKSSRSYPLQGDSIVEAFDGQYRGFYPGSDGGVWRPTSSMFGLTRKNLDGTAKLHSGIDIYAPVGTPIFAPVTGKLRHKTQFAKQDPEKKQPKKMTGLGRYAEIEFSAEGKTWLLLIGHLSGFEGKEREIKPEQAKAGHVIGYVGVSGNASGAANKNGISASHIHVVLQQKLSSFPEKKKSRVDPAKAFGWKLDEMTTEPVDRKIIEAKISWITSSPLKTAERLKAPDETGLPEVQIPIRFNQQAQYYKDVAEAVLNDNDFKIVEAWVADAQSRSRTLNEKLERLLADKDDKVFYDTLFHANSLIKSLLVGGAMVALIVPAATLGATATTLLGLGGLIYTVTGDVMVNALQVTYEKRQGFDPDPVYAILGTPTNVGEALAGGGSGMPAVFSRAIVEQVAEDGGKIVLKRMLGVLGGVADIWAMYSAHHEREKNADAFDERLKALIQTVTALSAALDDYPGGEIGIRTFLEQQARGNAAFFEKQDKDFKDLVNPFRPANYVLAQGR
ncbi:M23 family metallopeptidase [Celeribacter sp.]|uniref:M23 family metallopeptidase n=1 Tax=Celeribacter sp. TaxID=1890673 RepID=UPI003A8DF579